MEGTSKKLLSVFDLSKADTGLLQSKELYQIELTQDINYSKKNSKEQKNENSTNIAHEPHKSSKQGRTRTFIPDDTYHLRVPAAGNSYRFEERAPYILETNVYPNEAEVLKELREITATQHWSHMLSAADEGPIMSLLLKLLNAERTIEIGVYTGYSLLVTALALPKNGKIIAIDPDRSMFEIGLPFFKKAGVEHKVEFVESIALPILDKLLEDPKNEGSFDYAFIDADKDNYVHYHERLLKLVRVGGMILYDNTLWSGTVAWKDDSSLDEKMKYTKDVFVDLNKKLASDSRIQVSQLPVGDGLTMCMRLR